MSDDTQIIADTVMKLADKLGIAVSEVARIFIEAQPKLAMVDLYMMVGTILSTLIVVSIAWYIAYKIEKKKYAGTSLFDANVFMPVFFAGMIWLIIVMFAFISLENILYRLSAPEYMGLRDMIQTLRP